jgi:hypothetical protein
MDRIEDVKRRLMAAAHGCYRICGMEVHREPGKMNISLSVDVDNEGKTKRFLIRIGISSKAYDNPSFDLYKLVSEKVDKTVGVAIKRASW